MSDREDAEYWLSEVERDPALGSDATWRSDLEAARPFLRMVLPFDLVERVERVFKKALRTALGRPLDGDSARFVARLQKEVGFVLKYKSYALKCTSPLGYSIFLQQPREGFSFQRHVTRKTEVFHVLEPLDGARVFLCSTEDWDAAYEPAAFAAWLNGAPDDAFERHSVVPRGGDVFHVDRLRIVHTVLGCVLEEFATVSEDMVDRLHDQNAGRAVTFDVKRADVEAKLRALRVPEGSAVFPPAVNSEPSRVIPERVVGGVSSWKLSSGLIDATRYSIPAGGSTAPSAEAQKAASVFVMAGRGEVEIFDEQEGPGRAPAIPVEAGDLLLVPPIVRSAYRAGSGGRLVLSEQKIDPALALD